MRGRREGRRERERKEGRGRRKSNVKLIQSELLGPAAGVTLKTVFLSFLFSPNLLSPLPLSSIPPVSRYFSASLSFLIRGAILLYRAP